MTFKDVQFAKDEVRQILMANSQTGLTYIQDVCDAVYKGFNTFLDEYGGDTELCSASKALVLRDKIAKELRALALVNTDDYEFRDDQNSYCLAVARKLNLRIKKMDEEGKPRPGSTERYDLFCKQAFQLSLASGETTKINLFIGYNLDDFFTTLRTVFISCPNPDDTSKIIWRLPAEDLLADETFHLFPVVEEEILPINIKLKENLRNVKDRNESFE